MSGRRRLAPAGLALALALGAVPAAADELYRCPGPGGGTLYTSDPSRCAEAERHEPSGEIQRIPGSAASAPRRGGAPAAAEAEEELRRAEWRRRRERAEAEHAELEELLPVLRRARGVCARGGEVEVEDHLGLHREVSCETVRGALREAERREAELREYLEEGLAEECRRAGCLPGWVRGDD